MGTVSFLHAADLHLDTPFEGLGAVRPDVAALLRDASLAAWDRLVDLALSRRVDFLVLAGDVYDGPSRGVRAQLRFRRGLERLSVAGIRCFVVHGNHDPVEEGWGAITWPAGVHVFAAGEVESVQVERDGARIATVHGASFGTRKERENLARRFRRGAEPGLHVGLLHCNVEGQAGHDPYAPCSLADLQGAGMDYWALGHVHTRQLLAPTIAYPGNLQGRSVRETGPRGALLVRAEGSSVVSVEFEPLAPVEYASIELDVGGLEDLGAIEAAALERVRRLERPGLEGLVVELRLRGATDLHAGLLHGAEELRTALDDAGAGRPFVHWCRVEVGTRPPFDAEALAARDDFAGALIRALGGLRESGALAELCAGLDEKVAKGNLARLVREASGQELEGILVAAEALAAERLGGEA